MQLDTIRDPNHAPVGGTMLQLVCALGEVHDREEEIEREARELINSGRYVLTGNFRGCTLN